MNRQQRRLAARQRRGPGEPPTAATVDVGQTMAAGLAHHREGRLTQADSCYRQVLAHDPNHPDALHLLGMLAFQAGNPVAALDLIERAVAREPASPVYINNRAFVLRALARPEEALAGFERAIALRPDYVEAHFNRGLALTDLGRAEAAVASFDRALALQPNNPAALFDRGFALTALRRFDAALASLDRLLALNPNDAEAHSLRGTVLAALGRPGDALASYDRAVALRPDAAPFHYKRGTQLLELERPDAALAAFDRALALQPDLSEALTNRGFALAELGRPEEALADHDRAAALRPGDGKTWGNRGIALSRLNRQEAALADFDRALALLPDHAETHANRGAVLNALGRLPEALAAFDRALALKPAFPEAARNKGYMLLAQGRFAEGWPLHEQRLASGHADRGFAQPAWRGEPLAGRTLLLHAEQGFGDTIQFCRYAPLAARQGAVVMEVQPALLPLLAGQPAMPPLLARGDPLPPFDLHCPLPSLPLAFATELASIPSPTAYLAADPARIAAWAPRLDHLPVPRAGIVWSGNPRQLRDAERSLPLAELLPLLDCGVTLLSLQADIARETDREVLERNPAIVRLAEPFRDFADTAAVIAQLDLVIAVDTSVAHLAAALGRPTWVMLHTVPDWRWLLGREDSPWYASAQLFRQTARGDWAGVVERVRQALLAFAAAPPPVTPAGA
jgi:tetratricopeptide (TPR) repeat protein